MAEKLTNLYKHNATLNHSRIEI